MIRVPACIAAQQPKGGRGCERSCSIPETTGLPLEGHRLVEIGLRRALSIACRAASTFTAICRPERDIPPRAFAVHGLSSGVSQSAKPRFAEIVTTLAFRRRAAGRA